MSLLQPQPSSACAFKNLVAKSQLRLALDDAPEVGLAQLAGTEGTCAASHARDRRWPSSSMRRRSARSAKKLECDCTPLHDLESCIQAAVEIAVFEMPEKARGRFESLESGPPFRH